MKIINLWLLILYFNSVQSQAPYVFYKKLSTWGTDVITSVAINHIAFRNDEKYLAAGTVDGSLLVWEVESGKIIKDLSEEGNPISIYDIEYTPDGKYLVTVGNLKDYSSIKVWDAKTLQLLKTIEYDTLRPIDRQHDSLILSVPASALCFSPDGKYMITATLDGVITTWQTGSWQQIEKIETAGTIWDIDFDSNKYLLATASEKGCVHMWDFKNGHLLLKDSIFFNNDELTSVNFSSNAEYISTNANEFLKIINSETKMIIRKIPLTDSISNIIWVDWSTDGKYFVTGHVFNNVCIWAVETFEIIGTLQGDTENPFQNESGYNFAKPLFSPNNNFLALSNDAGFIYLYKYKQSAK